MPPCLFGLCHRTMNVAVSTIWLSHSLFKIHSSTRIYPRISDVSPNIAQGKCLSVLSGTNTGCPVPVLEQEKGNDARFRLRSIWNYNKVRSDSPHRHTPLLCISMDLKHPTPPNLPFRSGWESHAVCCLWPLPPSDKPLHPLPNPEKQRLVSLISLSP